MKNNCLILGAGSWGTAIANVLAQNGVNTTIWARNSKITNDINILKINRKYFPKIKLSKNLKSISGHFDGSQYDFIFYVIPASNFEQYANLYLLGQKIKNLIICSKGVSKNGEYLSYLSSKLLNVKNLYFFSDPSFADEVLHGRPTAISISGKNSLEKVGRLFLKSNIRVYFSKNIKSIEFLGIIKNIYAIGSGIVEGLKLGENARAAYITRCIHEIKIALKLYNLDSNQIFSLAGLGDLLLSCSSKKSRNYKFGYMYIANKSSIKNLKKTIEGLQSAINLQRNKNFKYKSMPILNSIIKILNGENAMKEVKNLLERKFKYEKF